ncbi:MAG: radical SAM protein [Candidatus Aenigmatarchaeota archaeon]
MDFNNKLCKSLLRKSGLHDSEYSINPYTGCSNGCVYCYAPYIMREGRKWGKFVDIKINAPEVLEKELEKVKSGTVLISSVTDCYQPMERKYGITRKILEKLKNTNLKVSILTKCALVTRDIDILRQMDCKVGLTITTMNDSIRETFEPKASPIKDRLDALKKLKEAGIRTYIFFGPMLPYMSDKNIEETLKAFSDLKVDKIYFDKLNIRHPYQWSKIKSVLEANYEDMVDRWKAAIYGEEYYRDLKKKIIVICNRLNLKYEFCY